MFEPKADVHYGRATTTKVRRSMPLHIDRLRKMRLERRKTQQYMADQLGVSQPQYNDWEKGKYAPQGETVAKFAAILGVTSDYLYGLVDNPDETLKEEGLSEFERQVVRVIRANDVLRFYIAKLLDLPAQPPALSSSNESNDEPKISS